MLCANAAPVTPLTSKPWAASRARTASSACAAIAATSSRLTTSAGVPALSISPNHALAVRSAWPKSARVGTSGSSGERFGPLATSARSVPARAGSTADWSC